MVSAASAQQPLCERVRALTEQPAVAAAHWGISVIALDGAPVCTLNAAQLFRPASNAKLFTSAAALALLGPQRSVATTVTGALDPSTGNVTGDLTLTGAGDANLDSGDLPYLPAAQRPKAQANAFRDLDDLAAQLAAKGVTAVSGDVVGDDTLFPWEPYGPSWNADDLTWGYGAPVSALTIADNQLRLVVTPGRITGMPGQQSFPAASVTLEQNGVPYYTIEPQVETRAAKSPAGVSVERLPGTRTIRVFGSIAEDAPPDVEQIAIDDPAAYAAMAFRKVLEAHGIHIDGSTRSKHRIVRDGQGFLSALRAPGGQEKITVAGGEGGGSCVEPLHVPVLASHLSAPLADDVLFTDKTSQNLHAELLFHRLGRRVFCGQGSSIASARMVRAFLLHAGVAEDDFMLYDGSGLSDHDLTTPRALTSLLVFAARQPWFASFKAALPVGGVDGSLSARFTGPLKGRVFAKTGTLGETRALSGYVVTDSGRTLAFSILTDTHFPGTTADRTAADRIVELLATE
jgi:D-alanyl-D-alanine carboxypeptidase/D-alanyl-D-alanine-endopeptidase (penicillin-binding protein 4)